VVHDAVSCIKAGGTVVMFPEGTRSEADNLMKFRRGAFQIAQMANVPLIPLWLNCEPRYMGRNQGFRGYPKRGKVSLYLFPFVADQSEFLVEDARGAAKFWEERYLKKLNSFG
jgi:1-acyl-sn-glycerol-3-phosphate acyltransferase